MESKQHEEEWNFQLIVTQSRTNGNESGGKPKKQYSLLSSRTTNQKRTIDSIDRMNVRKETENYYYYFKTDWWNCDDDDYDEV